MTLPRVVSLLPSTTEIVCAVGLEQTLVGRSHECDHPPSVTALPVLTRSRVPDAGSSAIDLGIRGLIERGLSIYDVDADLLQRLEPSLIVTQDQCAACAVSLRDVVQATQSWITPATQVISVSPTSLSEVWSDVVRIGDALGAGAIARQRVDGYVDRVRDIEARVALCARVRVVCIEWLDPLMTAGNWVSELIAAARGESVLARGQVHSPWVTWEQIVAADPDVILVMPCGFPIARTRAEIGTLRAREGFDALRAVRDGRCFLVDGNAYFNRAGPRLIESLEILAELLHPDVIQLGHRGSGWEPLD